MNVKKKLGIIYAITHCGSRGCNNCAAKGICNCEDYRVELYKSLRDDINNLIKERDKAVAALKEKSEN